MINTITNTHFVGVYIIAAIVAGLINRKLGELMFEIGFLVAAVLLISTLDPSWWHNLFGWMAN
ncbi:MAG: hypothetical protein PF483_05995 [Halothiobacillus sp.]|jgi:hypothetical protein|nr:hypothetical protein [Halothiobacillus sp.]